MRAVAGTEQLTGSRRHAGAHHEHAEAEILQRTARQVFEFTELSRRLRGFGKTFERVFHPGFASITTFMTVELAASKPADQGRLPRFRHLPEFMPRSPRQPDSIGSCTTRGNLGCVVFGEITVADDV
jgi:hypothetical protein